MNKKTKVWIIAGVVILLAIVFRASVGPVVTTVVFLGVGSGSIVVGASDYRGGDRWHRPRWHALVAQDFDVKRFAETCLIALVAFALANIASLFIRSDDPDDPDSKERYGFPLLISDRMVEVSDGVAYYPEGPFQYYSHAALWGDMVIALVGSMLGARIYTYVATKPKRIE